LLVAPLLPSNNFIAPAGKCSKSVIPAQAGNQKKHWLPDQVRHDGVGYLVARLILPSISSTIALRKTQKYNAKRKLIFPQFFNQPTFFSFHQLIVTPVKLIFKKEKLLDNILVIFASYLGEVYSLWYT